MNDSEFRAAWEHICDGVAGRVRRARDGEAHPTRELQEAVLRVLDVVEERAEHLPIITEH